jgi:hypothetical protein
MKPRNKIFAFLNPKIVVAATELAKTLTSLLVPYHSSTDPDCRVAQFSPQYHLVGGAVLQRNIQCCVKGTHFIVHVLFFGVLNY